MSLSIEIQKAMPVHFKNVAFRKEDKIGLVIIDEVKGFAEVGAGALAPVKHNKQIDDCVAETDRLAKEFTRKDLPILAFQDCHIPGKEEPPYPPHCEAGSGEEELVDTLVWLHNDSNTTILQKDCINGFIGAMGKDGENQFVSWVNKHELEHLIFVGMCTDICVMDLVLTCLSARNHEIIDSVQDVVVYEPACATYDMDEASRVKFNLPETSLHPQELTHHLGLYIMASRGAIIASTLTL
jgi:nicotinamidase-related amidase